MASFLTDLFESIFTPGPTPPLVLATNVTFALLQIVLLLLLVATYSVHFLVLSFLSGGLWWAINWFIRELNLADGDKERASRDPSDQSTSDDPSISLRSTDGVSSATSPRRSRRRRPGTSDSAALYSSGTETEDGDLSASQTPTAGRPGMMSAAMSASAAALHRPRGSLGGDVSGTDSEWDKVSEAGGLDK